MLVILAITLGTSILVGRAAGGSARALSTLTFRWVFVLYVALGLGLMPLLLESSRPLTNIALAGAYSLVAVFLVRNTSQRQIRWGFAVMLVGWLLNATVIASNGAMPLSLWAYHESGQTEAPTPGEGGFFKIELADADTRLRFLGDVIPVTPIAQVISLGDIALVVGAGLTVFMGMRSSQTNL